MYVNTEERLRTIILAVHHETEYVEEDFPTIAKVEVTPKLLALLRRMQKLLCETQAEDHIYGISAAHWEPSLIAGVDPSDYCEDGQLVEGAEEQEAHAQSTMSLNVMPRRFNWTGFLKYCGTRFFTDHIYIGEPHNKKLPWIELEEPDG